MNLELSNEIDRLFTTNNWDWTLENTQNQWAENFNRIALNYPCEDFFVTFKNFLNTKSNESLVIIVDYFVKPIYWSLKNIPYTEKLNLSGNLLDLQVKMLAEKRPIHKHYNSSMRYGMKLDRRLFFNKTLSCFLEQASTEALFYIWKKRLHLMCNPSFEYKRNTPGNNFKFPVDIFVYSEISESNYSYIYFISYEPNHQEILFHILQQQIDSLIFSERFFASFFSLLKDIANKEQAFVMLEKSIIAVANKLKNRKSIEELQKFETEALSYFFSYLKTNFEAYNLFTEEFNNSVDNETITFKLWSLFRYFTPTVEFLNKHLIEMDLDDYLESPKDFHLKIFEGQMLKYDEFEDSEHTYLGLVVMNMIESPSKIYHFLSVKSILHKLVLFYTFNASYFSLGKNFEVNYELTDFKFTKEELLSLNNLEIEYFKFIRLFYFIRLIQGQYSSKTYRFSADKPVGFFKMGIPERVALIEMCWKNSSSVKNDFEKLLTEIIISVKSESTLFFGEKMIKSISKNNKVHKEDLFQNIELNAKSDYIDALLQFVKININ